MADRYWVGGTASWDATAGTKWATTSGGAGGATVPTAADDVYFNAASGAVSCTVSATANCRNLNFTGFTGSFQMSNTLNVYGSCTLSPTMTFGVTANTLQLLAETGSWTFTSAGKTVGPVRFGGLVTGATFTLQDALVSSSTITVAIGTFNTNNFNVTATGLSSSNSNTRTINLGSSTVTLTTSNPIAFGTSTNLTFNAGTSTIVCTASGSVINGGGTSNTGVTFNNVSLTNTTASTYLIAGTNTFNNLTIAGPASAGVMQVGFSVRQNINGVLSTTGTAGNRRVWFRSDNYGLAQTLTINSAPSLTDADFRDLYVVGTAAPISGTRIGNLRGCRGITFSTPKTVYWNQAAGGSWSDNAWAATSGGAVSTDNFPLAQDTAVIENTGLNTSATVTLDSSYVHIGTINMSTRTNAMTLAGSTTYVFYGNFIFGSGVTRTYSGTLQFSGRNTQTITSAGKSFANNFSIDTYGGTVQLADALDIGVGTLTVTNGTFSTQNYNVNANSLSSSNSNVRAINLGSSTLTFSGNPIAFSTNTNLTFNAGTSTIIATASGGSFVGGGATTGVTFYDVSINSVVGGTPSLNGVNTFRNLTVGSPGTAGIISLFIQANQTITGTLTCAGATAVRRIFLCSDTLGTTRTLTVNSLSAQDCDFRDITIAGAAAGSSPTRAGDCGGNTGINFPAPKTVYWNLAGTQNWSADGWATSSGGTPATNNFPLAQDTAVFDNTGAAGTVTLNTAWNIGTFNASARTSAMTFNLASCQVYGNWSHGSGLTFPGQNAGVDFFRNGGTQTITSNGVSFGTNRLRPGTVNGGRVLLADAFTSSGQIQHNGGEFDANGFNVTASGYESTNTVNMRVLRMGGGLWTLTGTGSLWSVNASTTFTLYKSTSNILLSDTSTSARSFTGSALSYNKLTIGGATGTSTFTFNDGNQFTELASTKTVAHTINLGSTSQTLGAWTVTGTVGNVVTISGFSAQLTIAGARVSGVNYLAMGTTSISSVSPGEFYAGPNSTGTGSGVILTAAPAPVTRYWVGGTGTWDATTTTNWSATSGGAGGASVPTSVDSVIFNNASSIANSAYTVTIGTNAVVRCADLTMNGPGAGNRVTWTAGLGTPTMILHGNFNLAGGTAEITRTYNAPIILSGSATGRTFTTNGVTIASNNSAINGVGCGWVLGSALNDGGAGSTWYVRNGSFNTAGYAVTLGSIASINNGNTRSITLGSSTLTVQGFSEGFTNNIGLTLDAGTSQINCTTYGTWNGGGLTFRNVSFTGTSAGTATINGTNTFNNLTFAGITSAGVNNIVFANNQTINGTLTLSAGTDATMRTFVRSDTIGTTRTLTCAAFSGTDADFRDITIAGAAAPVSGTRLGDCKGNSGITFDAPKTVYWNASGNANWGSTGFGFWALTSGGTLTQAAFPLAQDTAVFTSTAPTSGFTTTINAAYNIGTIDMSARTSNTMTLATGGQTPTIYGNLINGTGTTLTGSGALTFAGRGSQTITSAGRTFTQPFIVNTPGGEVALQDSFVTSSNVTLTAGTFNATIYNVTLSGASASFSTSSTATFSRVVAVGSGVWSFAGSSFAWDLRNFTNLTVTGTGTISLTNASSKTFAGGGANYSGITLNQGGAGTLTITGDNTFANISNSYKATGATTIALGTTTQRVGTFTASGEAGRVLTVQGTSLSNPATLIYTGSGPATPPATDYLALTGIRAYSLDETWYAGANSTNNGTLGWIFAAAAVVGALGNFFIFFMP